MNWKSIDQKEFFTDLSRESRGNIQVSPYSIPEAFRVLVAPDRDDVILEFKYISPDSTFENLRLIDGVLLEVGKETKRIYKFILESGHHSNPKDCMNLLNLAIEALASKSRKSVSRDKVSWRLLDRNRAELANAIK